MLSMHSEDTLVLQALDAGARGYILKKCGRSRSGVRHIRRVAAGEIVSAPEVSRSPSLKGERRSGLTPRELEILQLIVEGNSNKAIADRLSLSANTVAVHRANIMNTLDIHKTAELVVYAIHQWSGEYLVNRRSFLLGMAGLAASPLASQANCSHAGWSRHHPPRVGFRLTDVTSAAGIQFHHNSGASAASSSPGNSRLRMPFLDYDADGRTSC